MQPELIILSLGTNDSYGRNFDEAAVGAQVEKLIGLLKEYFPLCPLLLTTPMECWSRVRVKGRYVRKPNPNAERVRDQIVQAAGRHGLPVWDFYAVAGGDGAMERWYRAGLAGADRIHLSHDGYRLQGDPALRRAGESLQRLQGTARNDRYCRGRPSTEKDRNAYGGNGWPQKRNRGNDISGLRDRKSCKPDGAMSSPKDERQETKPEETGAQEIRPNGKDTDH